MTNERGYLPKADRSTLSPELRERLEVWYGKAYEDDNLFLTLARSPAVLELFLGGVRMMYAADTTIDPKVAELARIRSAARAHCVH